MTESAELGAKRGVKVQFLQQWAHAMGAGGCESRKYLQKWVQAVVEG